jgi:hypothetical protein
MDYRQRPNGPPSEGRKLNHPTWGAYALVGAAGDAVHAHRLLEVAFSAALSSDQRLVNRRTATYRGSPVPVIGTDGALQLVGLTASALSAGSANLGNLTDATLRACGSGTRPWRRSCIWRARVPAAPRVVVVFVAAVSHDTSFWCPMGLLVLVVVVSVFWRCRPTRWEQAGDGELADRFAPPVGGFGWRSPWLGSR